MTTVSAWSRRSSNAEVSVLSWLKVSAQYLNARFELIHQREIFVATARLDFIDAQRADCAELAVGEFPMDHPFHCIEDLLPAGPKALRRFFPRQLASPLCKGKAAIVAEDPDALARYVPDLQEWPALWRVKNEGIPTWTGHRGCIHAFPRASADPGIRAQDTASAPRASGCSAAK